MNMPVESKLQRLKERTFAGPAGGVVRGMATLAAGNIVAKLIGLSVVPFLTRLYNPEDFGVLAVLTSLISILAPTMTLRYVLAMPLPRRDGMAVNLLALSGGLMLVMNLIIAVFLWVFGVELLGMLSMEKLAPYWWLIIIGLVGVSGYEVMSLWATRKKAFRLIAKAAAIQSFAGNIIKVVLGLLHLMPLGLLIGQVISISGGVASLVFGFSKDLARLRKSIKFKKIKVVAIRYRDFPTYRLPSQFLLAFSAQAPVLFFAYIYDAQSTGQLSMAMTVISLPLSMLGNSFSQSYYAEIAKIGLRNPGLIAEITKSVTKKLLKVSIFPFLILMFFGEDLFSILFGKEWALGGNFASILSIYLVMQFITAPVMNFFNVMDRQIIFLLINIFRSSIIFIVFMFFSPLFELSSSKTVLVYSVVMAMFYLGVYIYVLHQINNLQKGREKCR